MRVRILGAAAGGGFPQWNCNCANCRIARHDPVRAKPRTQSCVAVSGDGEHWFFVNASPDIRTQIESFPPLLPRGEQMRGSRIAGVLLTNADLDHTLGLLLLREGRPLDVYATDSVRHSLSVGLRLDDVMRAYCGIHWKLPPVNCEPLLDRLGDSTGLACAGFAVPGKRPRYSTEKESSAGDAIGYRFIDTRTGGRLVVIPDAAVIDGVIRKQMSDADLILFDGTFYDEIEMQTAGAGEARASEMGHVPVDGADGSLKTLATLTQVQRVYIHVNNTNPMLLDDSPQRAVVEAAGVRVGYDGMEFEI